MPRVALHVAGTLAPGMTPMGRSIRPNYFSELERSSRLGLTWANGVWLGSAHRLSGLCPQLSWLPVAGSAAGPAVPAGVGSKARLEGFQLGDQGAEPPVVVEPGLVVGELVVGRMRVTVFAGDLAGPLVVGAVQPGRVGVAAAAGVAAAGASAR